MGITKYRVHFYSWLEKCFFLQFQTSFFFWHTKLVLLKTVLLKFAQKCLSVANKIIKKV